MIEETLLVFLVIKLIHCVVEGPIVQTEFGAVRGVYEENEFGKFFSYNGIPFARHPPGNIFGDPVDPYPWHNILEANEMNVICPQREETHQMLVGDIDCLKLNVYVPASRSSLASLPVLYFLYGGEYKLGFASRDFWGPFRLVRHEVILVMASYRVGPFGFLCLGTKDIPGNAGLKDVRKGLEWVKNNIEHFGGNKSSVTLGGSSTGATIAEQIIASPTTNHLYHRVILQSGSVHSRVFQAQVDHRTGVLNMASYFGYKTSIVEEAVQFLQNIRPLDIKLASEHFMMTFLPCIEPKIDGVENFLTDFAARYLETGNFKDVDMITGFNTMEFLLRTSTKEIVDTPPTIFTREIGLLHPAQKDLEQVAKASRHFYIGSQNISNNVELEMSMFYSDSALIYPIMRSADQHRSKSGKVYLYEFGYSGSRNLGIHRYGLSLPFPLHADELGYLFYQPDWKTPMTANDQLISDRMTTMWTNFIKYGDPTPKVTELLPIKWQPMGKNSNEYLYINTDMRSLIDPLKERMAFWDMICYNYYRMKNIQDKLDDIRL